MSANRMRFGVVGMNHGHIYGMVDTVVRAGGELVSFHASEPEPTAEFARQYPTATWSHDERAVLEDRSLQLVLSSITPSERASLGIRVMQHGKDYLVDKPGVTTLDQLAEVRRVQTATKRIYSIMYSERLENGATIRAGDLVRDGAIGAVVQTIGLGPHRGHNDTRHRRLHRSAKNVDLAGRAGGNHLFLADAKGVRYVDCNAVELPFGRQLVDDVMDRTETAMTQAHCFLAAELALLAQSHARIIE